MLAGAVGLAAAVGAMARYLLDLYVQSRHDAVFPFGTLVVNASGCLLLGVVTGLAAHHGLARAPATVLSAGLAGGYTTWSTWAWETLALAESGARLEAAANVVASLAVGLVLFAGGYGLTLL